MTIAELHWEVKNKYDAVTANKARSILPHELDAALNAARVIWFYRTYNPERLDNRAFELSQHQMDKLANFVIKSPSVDEPGLSPETVTHTYSSGIVMQEFDLSNTAFDYANMIRLSAKLTDCTDLIEITLVDHDDLATSLNNEYLKPNDTWNRVVATMGRSSGTNTSSVYVYRTTNQTIEKLYPEYLRFPVEMTIGGYNDISGTPKVLTECDIAERFHNELVDIAVVELKRIIDLPPQAYQDILNK